MRVTGTSPIDNAEWRAQECGQHASRHCDVGKLDAASATHHAISRSLQSRCVSEEANVPGKGTFSDTI